MNAKGFSLAELIVVIAVIGILMVIGIPTFLSYWQSATLRGGAQQVVALLNSARQLAIKENTTVCVKADNTTTGSYSTNGAYGSRFQYFLATTCSGSAWTGAGTDSSGYIPMENDVRVQSATTGMAFTYLGAASAVGGGSLDIVVCNSRDTGRRARVTTSVSGRITTAYENTAC